MIYFIRHGESEANLKNIFAGQRDDSVLTGKGREQARETASEIKKSGIVIDKIISSPLKRAFETAEIVAQEIGFDINQIEVDKRITEYDMGSLTGTPLHEISSLALISADYAEDISLFKQRILSCMYEYLNSNEDILIVSHAGVGRVLETIRLDMDTKFFYDLSAYKNASFINVDWIK